MGAGFFLAACWAWIAASAYELLGNPSTLVDLPASFAYLARLSLRAAWLASGYVLLAHAVRFALVRVTKYGDLIVGLALAGLLATPCMEQAVLLASGGQLTESELGDTYRWAFFLVLWGGHLGLWFLHLFLCRAEGFFLSRVRGASFLRGPSFALGAYVLVQLVQIENVYRQYAFLTRFLLPATWFLAATLTLAPFVALGPRTRVVTLGVAALGLALLTTSAAPRSAQRRAQSAFVRTGAVAGLTDLAVYPIKRVDYANIDFSRPKRFTCAPPPKPAPPARLPASRGARRNVILVSIDALRKDMLSAQIEGRPLMPALSAFAQQSIDYERAVTTYPATLFAIGSALTGQSSSEILFAPAIPANLFRLTSGQIDERFISLPKSAWFRKKIVSKLFAQDTKPERHPDAATQTRWMIERLSAARKKSSRVLAWVHYYEAHGPHEKQADFDFGSGTKNQYMSEVAAVDAQLGQLFAYLEKSGYTKDSLIIVFSDHGEALGEQGYEGHHVYLNSWITDIPLLVRAPFTEARKDDRLAEISDIAPTVLHFLGLSTASMPARSLFDPPDPDRFGFAEAFPVRGTALFALANDPIASVRELQTRMLRTRVSVIDYLPKVAVTSKSHRLIVNRVTGAEELYDRKRDPEELVDLADEGLPAQNQLRKALPPWTKQTSERIYCRAREAEEWSRLAERVRAASRPDTKPDAKPETKPDAKPGEQAPTAAPETPFAKPKASR